MRRGTPAIVGLDPRYAELPPALLSGFDDRQALLRAGAVFRFCMGVIDVVAPLVPAIKPQMAFFEALGPTGMQTLAAVVGYARERGLLVILDGKRNDIGSTAEAYANAYLGPPPEHAGAGEPPLAARDGESAWGGDALTVSPYLGDDSLEPFVRAAEARGAGIFVLVKTSNPGGGVFQDLSANGEPIYRHVARRVAALAKSLPGGSGYGPVGAVVGATYPEQLVELRSIMPRAWLLVPGYGAQGGTARDTAAAFDSRGLGALINSSRGIIFAHARREYRDRFAPADWQRAVEAATRDMIAELRSETPAGNLPLP